MPCRICSGPLRPFIASGDRNRGIGTTVFHYHRCARCGLIVLTDPPEDLDPYYPRGYYQAPSRLRLAWASWRERYQLRLVQRYSAGGRLVELGAAWGVFAYGARRAGFTVTAIERDPACCEFLASVVGVTQIQSDAAAEVLPHLATSQLIAMWQVAEHLDDVWEVLAASAHNLDRAGVLAIATPNPDALSLRLLRARWPHLDAPRHRWLIPVRVLDRFLATHGLERVLLTTDDPGGRRWNRFTWQRALSGAVPNWVAMSAGAVFALLMRPLERGRGSCYTALYRKPVTA